MSPCMEVTFANWLRIRNNCWCSRSLGETPLHPTLHRNVKFSLFKPAWDCNSAMMYTLVILRQERSSLRVLPSRPQHMSIPRQFPGSRVWKRERHGTKALAFSNNPLQSSKRENENHQISQWSGVRRGSSYSIGSLSASYNRAREAHQQSCKHEALWWHLEVSSVWSLEQQLKMGGNTSPFIAFPRWVITTTSFLVYLFRVSALTLIRAKLFMVKPIKVIVRNINRARFALKPCAGFLEGWLESGGRFE